MATLTFAGSRPTPRQKSVLVVGQVNAETITVVVDESWSGLQLELQFFNSATHPEVPVVVILDSTMTCKVPPEVTKEVGIVHVALAGRDSGTIIKLSEKLYYADAKIGADPQGGLTPEQQTPDYIAQMVEQATQANQAAREAKEYAQQVAESIESAGPYAEEAKKAAEAAKASETAAKGAADTATQQATKAQEAVTSIGNAVDQAQSAATAAGSAQQAAETAKVAAERSAETAGNAQSGASQSAQAAANSAQEAERAKQEAQKAAAAFPAPSPEVAGMVPMVNPEGTGYVFGEAGGGAIDDSTVSTGSTWSSLKIVESLAPEFEESGPVVTCNPVPGYPLSVVSQIVAVQSGSGDPSPENVRPISGWNEATIWRSGENLVNQSLAKNGSIGAEDGKLTINESASYGVYLSCDVNGDIHSLTFLGEYEGGVAGRWRICFTGNDNKLVPFTYTYDYPAAGGASTTFLDASGNSSKRLAVISNFSGASKMWICATDGRTKPPVITVVAGAVPDVAHSEYSGGLVTVDFGQTVYGGTLDWTTGVLTISHGLVDMGTLAWIFNDTTWKEKPIFHSGVPNKALGYMIQSTSYKFAASAKEPYQLNLYEIMGYRSDARVYVYDDRYDSSDAFAKSVSGEKIVYQLKAPITVQLTPQEVLALSGVNTLYTNTGDTTVSGRADPDATIKGLLSRIDALEKAAIGGV